MTLTTAAGTLPVMEQVVEQAGSGEPETRGAAIARRMRALGMNYTSLGREARGMYRQTVKRAIENDPRTEEGTYELLETTLSRVEREWGHTDGPDIVVSTEDQLIEIEAEDTEGGFRFVVKGPVANADVLSAQVAKILADIRVHRRPPDGQ